MKSGINGLPYVDLRHPSGAQLDVYLHGAHVTSWRDAAGRQLLFMSEKSDFKPPFPIRGGIPVIFPQFSGGPLPTHGFARITEWKFLNSQMVEGDYAEAKLELCDNPQTLQWWPHEFLLEVIFRLRATELEIELYVTNMGKKEFEFNNGLHTYFSVTDINRISVEGLAGSKLIDFVGLKTEETEKRTSIPFDRETDRVYLSAPDTVLVQDNGSGREIIIEKHGMKDVVLWNPWVEKSKRMKDFGNLEYKTMVCVETGNLHGRICLKPGAVHKGITKYKSVIH